MTEGFNLDDAIRKVPDFPKKGILFYDITSILTNPDAFRFCIDSMAEIYEDEGLDAVAAIESRGFLFASPLCDRLSLPLVLVRKKGKLPGKTRTRKYELEYGEAEIEMHEADIPEGGEGSHRRRPDSHGRHGQGRRGDPRRGRSRARGRLRGRGPSLSSI